MKNKYLNFFLSGLGVLVSIVLNIAQARERGYVVYLYEDPLGPSIPECEPKFLCYSEDDDLFKEVATEAEGVQILNEIHLENAKTYTRAFRDPKTLRNLKKKVYERGCCLRRYEDDPRCCAFLIGTDHNLAKVHLYFCWNILTSTEDNEGDIIAPYSGVTIPTDEQLAAITTATVNNISNVLQYTARRNLSGVRDESQYPFSMTNLKQRRPPSKGQG